MEDKIFFMPGDVVTLKLDIPNKPIMVVMKKVNFIFKHTIEEKENKLRGIKCRWFTSSGEMREAIWSTKDLIKYKK